MKSPKNFEKMAILKIWEPVSFWGGKTHFGKTPLKSCIFRHDIFFCLYQYGCNSYIAFAKCSLYGILIMFWSFFATITYTKDNFCFQEAIFQWQIKFIFYRSVLRHLRKKSAFIAVFSKFFGDLMTHIIREYAGK